MKKLIFIFVLFSLSSTILAQSEVPKREFRAAWISTVTNIDWPRSKGSSTERQKEELIEILDYLKATNINAVVFQVRPACDAMYESSYEPWSYWLTGKQGRAPSPFYDPLKFAIEEAHKRGMELHAWFNPYRVDKSSFSQTLDSENPAVENPDWVLNISGDKILDPGLPQVREYLVDVIMDVVSRYDVDGVHFDDYFYIDGITTQDSETYQNHSRGFTNKGDWRRDNVHELVRAVHSSIQETKPNVKFGISPFGIWKNGIPTGTYGWNVYSTIYCDAITWLDEKIIDYLAPQLYWEFGGGQDYGKLMPWWVMQRNTRHIYPGLAFYRVGNEFDRTQLGRMISLNRETVGCEGQIFFTAHNVNDNPLNNTDTLKNNYYRYKSIIPQMDWKDMTAPAEPTELKFDKVEDNGIYAITWNQPEEEDIARYALYMFDESNISNEDLEDVSNLYDITSKNYYSVTDDYPAEKKYLVVTALDHNNNESEISNVFEFDPTLSSPETPTLIYPEMSMNDMRDTVKLSWNSALNASSYKLLVAYDENFTMYHTQKEGIEDTSFALAGLTGETTYYWKVKSTNISGESNYSETFSFTTGFPAAPQLVYPTDVTTDLELDPIFTWNKSSDAYEYRLIVAEGLGISSENIIIDTTIVDTSYYPSELLKTETFYAWKVNATNSLGTSVWADLFKFKTHKDSITAVDEIGKLPGSFALEQNYPNPFNPTTNIAFSVPEDVHVKITIFDMLGREVATLVNETKSAGNYKVEFNAANLSSGMYLYRISAGNFTKTKKLILLK